MELASAAFAEQGRIPRRHSRLGANASPALAWSAAPRETEAFVLLCTDPDAPGGTFTHWVLYDLPGAVGGLPEGVEAADRPSSGGKHGRNDFGRDAYDGPAPPAGPEHRYLFELFALSEPLGLPPGAPREDVERAMDELVLARARLTGLFARGGERRTVGR